MKKILLGMIMLAIVAGCSSKNNVIDLNNDGVALWDKATLETGTLIEADLRVKMSIESMDTETIKVKLLNQTCWDCGYAQYYELHVLLDDVWYKVPSLPNVEEKPAYGNIIEGYTTQILEYKVKDKYGVLPSGEYRIVVEGHTSEFFVK